ncbi:MAG: hypothetical protein GY803_10805 [Chloroflexi bacterium]|nr:hypothetical protein [Chloroflexota bacterium]
MNHKLTKLLLLLAISLLLAACGAEAEEAPTLNRDDGVVGETAVSPTNAPLDDETKVMNFAQCMRDEGIEYQDPVVDAKGNVQRPELVAGVSITREELAEPYAACAHHIEGLAFGRKDIDVSEQVDRLLPVMACLRDKGYDVDDPTVETFTQWAQDFRAAFDWGDADAMAAYEECSER